MGHVGTIAEKLHTLLLAAAKVIPLTVETTVELSETEMKNIEEKFEAVLGKKVETSYVPEPGLVGGMRATAGAMEGWPRG